VQSEITKVTSHIRETATWHDALVDIGVAESTPPVAAAPALVSGRSSISETVE
jgi:hypothetical protein